MTCPGLLSRLRWFGCALALALVALTSFAARAEDPDKLPVPHGNYVSDFAQVIDQPSKDEMEALSRQVYEKAHATIVIVTVNSLDGTTIEDFATRLEDRWKVGPKNTDRGLLMIFAIQDHKRRIEVGSGLEGILNDAKVGDIGRTMVPQLKAGDYGSAILGGERQLAQVIADDAHVTLDTPVPAAPQHTYHYERTSHRSGGGWIGLIVFIVIVLLISRGGRGGGGGLLWFLLGSMMGGGGRDNDRWAGGGGFGGGGGGGGGSDGGDFGGGFGGGSGGGGASGDW